MAKKILIIGAGNIGIAIANMLSPVEYTITISDSNIHSLQNPKIPKTIATLTLDITDTPQLENALKGADYVVNAGPYFINSTIARAAVKMGTHYFDLSEDVAETEYIKNLDTGHIKTALVPQCGLAPGYISIATNSLTKKFDEVHDIKMRVGALPRFPTNELRYNITWSIDGLINEYHHNCHSIESGRLIETKALEGYETFVLDGDKYEAFNTSGGLGSLCDTLKGQVRSMNYKTIRYPGHHYLIKFLINDMKLDEFALKKVFSAAIPMTNQDMVLVFIEVTGFIAGKLSSRTITKKMYNDDNWSAIQLTTATGMCVMIEAHRQGKISSTGFINQEELSLADFDIIDSVVLKGVYSD